MKNKIACTLSPKAQLKFISAVSSNFDNVKNLKQKNAIKKLLEPLAKYKKTSTYTQFQSLVAKALSDVVYYNASIGKVDMQHLIDRGTDPNTLIEIEDSGSTLRAPFIFGLGADFKLGNGNISIIYDSLFALALDNKDNFPIDFSVGYKFNL